MKRARHLAAAGARTDGRLAGMVAEVDLLELPGQERGRARQRPIDELVEADYATVTPRRAIQLLRNIFNDAKMVVVEERDDIVGVITKIDLIEYLAERRGSVV